MNSILKTPQQLKQQQPLTQELAVQVQQQRQIIERILKGQDKRLLVITGPCSIHDPQAVLEYAEKLKQLQTQVDKQIYFVMRAYIEKPRTTVGWKGFLYDPHLNGQADLNEGLQQSRALYLQILQLGLPLASEILNPMVTGYFDDLLAWGAIGARTSESQIHREIASSLPYPVGFKNGTDGSVQIATDAILSSQHSHQFFAMGQTGAPVLLASSGNPLPHIILRGSNTSTNYDAASIQAIQKTLKQPTAIIVDCSHGNSGKDPLRQPEILQQVVQERALTQVRGVMLESHLVDGQQKISACMTYGQSVTDGCLGWDKTEAVLLEISEQLNHNNLNKIVA
ncbi:3-deoxy-7-phosphoheptulonate synthase [Acinetobacter brisouii]|jgi:3-deoxy-7-phosphoheptulonate synthase|uniref:3-deoxy-7-phosphoheptulonate synthase n=1 Tax=Acinetobacter brisouii TaxID=396323 RepID=UPI0005F7CE31|nr:3-deoxy-7-phosphoheptulonate synthase [Acinetobacter brisouii]KJV37835.1 phospho-2-dehydro-3-deoxyheptonate aldolase [Acinetobacter brisouii]